MKKMIVVIMLGLSLQSNAFQAMKRWFGYGTPKTVQEDVARFESEAEKVEQQAADYLVDFQRSADEKIQAAFVEDRKLLKAESDEYERIAQKLLSQKLYSDYQASFARIAEEIRQWFDLKKQLDFVHIHKQMYAIIMQVHGPTVARRYAEEVGITNFDEAYNRVFESFQRADQSLKRSKEFMRSLETKQ